MGADGRIRVVLNRERMDEGRRPKKGRWAEFPERGKEDRGGSSGMEEAGARSDKAGGTNRAR